MVIVLVLSAMGALDIAALTRSQWKPGQEYLDCPRNKTGVERRVWLWPETRKALAAAVAKRSTPAKQKFENRLLLAQLNQCRALHAPVDNLESNWAYMVMTALSWNLKAWIGLSVPVVRIGMTSHPTKPR